MYLDPVFGTVEIPKTDPKCKGHSVVGVLTEEHNIAVETVDCSGNGKRVTKCKGYSMVILLTEEH